MSPSREKKRVTPVVVSDSPLGSQSVPAQAFLGALIAGISNRMLAGASSHHRLHWNVGMSEWRAIVTLGGGAELIVRELSERADLDYALASKTLKSLAERGLVTLVQTRTRGRATVASLTAKGEALYREATAVSLARQERLLAGFTGAEVEHLRSLLERLEAGIGEMNTLESSAQWRLATRAASATRK